jgi:hypothetical protein
MEGRGGIEEAEVERCGFVRGRLCSMDEKQIQGLEIEQKGGTLGFFTFSVKKPRNLVIPPRQG